MLENGDDLERPEDNTAEETTKDGKKQSNYIQPELGFTLRRRHRRRSHGLHRDEAEEEMTLTSVRGASFKGAPSSQGGDRSPPVQYGQGTAQSPCDREHFNGRIGSIIQKRGVPGRGTAHEQRRRCCM